MKLPDITVIFTFEPYYLPISVREVTWEEGGLMERFSEPVLFPEAARKFWEVMRDEFTGQAISRKA